MHAPVSSTYRLQLHPGFTFDDAAKVAPYLAALGVSHVYCSPYLQAAPGSTHGYDVIDHTRVNRELGGDAAFDRFVAALRAAGLGQILDIVPNHMAISTAENRWWSDVLENGPSSNFAAYFDVEWDPPEARMRNTVLVPILGDHYGRELERGALTVEREGASFRVRYAEHAYPVAPRSLALLLGRAARLAGSETLAFLADAFGELPRPTATDRASVRRRHRDKEILRAQLERLLAEDVETARAVDRALAEFNADPESMHALLEMQMYRLAWWRAAGRDLGYRRFFDINTLIGLRMEDEQVFHDTHRLVLAWIARGILDGLRIDHPDGLRDPQEYFDRLRAAAPGAWIVAEKILEPGEPLLETFPIQGTTGYDFLNLVLRLFVDPAGEAPLTAFYAEFTNEATDYADVVHDRKLYVLREVLGSDVNRLTDLLLDICERHLRYRDYSRHHLTGALRELVACFPVYRTYVRPSTGDVPDRDRRIVSEATAAAAARRTDLEPALFDFLRDLLLLEIRGDLEDEFAARFQQLTGPAMAKGVEDTAFYTYNRFVALNEVGGDPSRFSIDPDAFHDAAAATLRNWPLGMLATATHDTKRGEDVRARLALLSECPDRWAAACRRWSAMAARHRTGDMPDRNAEYLLYQTLIGAWPIEAGRLTAYMEKATREAKVHTSWTAPNAEYDEAVRRFIDGIYGDAELLAEIEAFVEPLVAPGRVNALAQTLVRLTAPGVPDTYQGTELWSLSLVDPDNRRPVDFGVRMRALAELDALDPGAIAARADDGLPKLHVVREALALRRRQASAFGPGGAYTPLAAAGPRAAQVVAFARGDAAVTIVPRLVLTARGDWSGTTVTLPAGTWRNVLTRTTLPDGPVALDALWQTLPVALLERA